MRIGYRYGSELSTICHNSVYYITLKFLIGPNGTFLKSIEVMYTFFQVMYTSFRHVRACLFSPQIYDVMMAFY